MSKISSGSTMGKLYADAMKIEEKYASLVYELRHLLKEFDVENGKYWLFNRVDELLKKHEDLD